MFAGKNVCNITAFVPTGATLKDLHMPFAVFLGLHLQLAICTWKIDFGFCSHKAHKEKIA